MVKLPPQKVCSQHRDQAWSHGLLTLVSSECWNFVSKLVSMVTRAWHTQHGHRLPQAGLRPYLERPPPAD